MTLPQHMLLSTGLYKINSRKIKGFNIFDPRVCFYGSLNPSRMFFQFLLGLFQLKRMFFSFQLKPFYQLI